MNLFALTCKNKNAGCAGADGEDCVIVASAVTAPARYTIVKHVIELSTLKLYFHVPVFALSVFAIQEPKLTIEPNSN